MKRDWQHKSQLSSFNHNRFFTVDGCNIQEVRHIAMAKNIIIDDKYNDVTFFGVPCQDCIHYAGGFKCSAFPVGIPQEILDGNNDHSKPYPGDNGIIFGRQTWKP